jgi:hypothetical protein
MFVQNPPHPGRVYRRLRTLAKNGVSRFLEFECGGHCQGSLEETVRLYAAKPALSDDAFLGELAEKMYAQPAAREWAIRGWKAFDRGFGHIPIGLGETGCRIYSGRFGFAWLLCIATPMVRGAFGGGDHEHGVHWFSPYNFFHGKLAIRLEIAFRRALDEWAEASRYLAVANSLEGCAASSAREAASAEAYVLCTHSALNWCIAAGIDRPGSGGASYFDELAEGEMDLTRRFQALLQVHPWLWANNCWHPHRTPISQIGLGYLATDTDTFVAKLRIMDAQRRIPS